MSPGTVAAAAASGLAALLFLAGCSAPSSPAAQPPDPLTTGALHGVVVDDAIRPVAGALVSVTPGPRNATTGTDGTFLLTGLAPGSYAVKVHKGGLVDGQAQADVHASALDPPLVKIQLARDDTFLRPYYEAYVFDGFIDLSGGIGTGKASGGYIGASQHAAYQYTLTAYPQWAQDEMVWTSTQPVSQWLNHNFYYPDASQGDLNQDQRAAGPSPLLNAMNASVARQYVEGLAHKPADPLLLRGRVFTVATDEMGPALTVEQAFTVYTHLFYGYQPPPGWRFTDTGEVPQPPELMR
jgi:hypothetical protein